MILFITALLLAPPEAAEAYKLGVALFERGKAEEAIPHFERATALDPQNAQFWKVLGVAHAKLEDYRGAIEPFRKACSLNPKLTDACYYLGRALYASDHYDQALNPLEQAFQVDPVKARAETAIGQSLEALGQWTEAEKRLRAAVARHDASEQLARLALGRFLVRQGRPAEAVPILELAQSPESATSRYELGLALSQCDRWQDAAAHLRRAVALDPTHEAAASLLKKAEFR